MCRRWFPREFSKAPKKQLLHRALDDIRESIGELRYYKGSIFAETKRKRAKEFLEQPEEENVV
jgi:oligoribonuclease